MQSICNSAPGEIPFPDKERLPIFIFSLAHRPCCTEYGLNNPFIVTQGNVLAYHLPLLMEVQWEPG